MLSFRFMEAKEKISSTKDVIAIVREVAIIGGIAVLLINPSFLANRAAAIAEAAFAKGAISAKITSTGPEFTFEKKLETLNKLQQEPANVQRTKEIDAISASVLSQAQSGISEVKTVQLEQVRQQDRAKQAQDAPGIASGAGVYGIIVSADKQPDLAAYEVQQLKSRNLSDVAVYDRQGFLRTVAKFSDRNAAQSKLAALQGYRKTAYLVNISHWCPSTEPTDQVIAGVTVLECK